MTELVLITGGMGFIGAHTACALLEQGYAVRLLDRLAPPVHPVARPPAWLPREAELVIGDVRDRDIVAQSLNGVSAVIHLAAHQDYLPDFSSFFGTNTVGTALLYEVIVESGKLIRKIVIASSQATYGEGSFNCDTHGPFYPDMRPQAQLNRGDWEIRCPECGRITDWRLTDESHVKPQSAYGLSKYTQELVALNLGQRYDIPTTCLRYSITQGRWQSPFNAYSGICRIFTARALSGKPPIIFEDGQQVRDYVYAGDVATANVLALEDPRTNFECYNVGGGIPITALEYAEIVTGIVYPGLVPELPGYYRFGDTRHIASDSAKLRTLGWRNTRSAPEVVAEYAAWLQQTGFKDQATDAGILRMLELGALRKVEPAALQP